MWYAKKPGAGGFQSANLDLRDLADNHEHLGQVAGVLFRFKLQKTDKVQRRWPRDGRSSLLYVRRPGGLLRTLLASPLAR